MLKIGCHVSASGGVWNAPKNASVLGCETFQIFTRPPMGGKAPVIDAEAIEKFKIEMQKYYALPNPPHKGEGIFRNHSLSMAKAMWGCDFVVHAPYFINFGSKNPRIFKGSISVVREELERGSSLGAKYVMTHLGSFKDLGKEKGMKQAKSGLKEVLNGYKGSAEFLLEISAGSGEVIGGSFEELAELMEPLVKMHGFGGICFDTQHAFSSGYDLRDGPSILKTFKQFDKIIGLKWLKMSHINDSKVHLGGKKDRHEHIGEGKIGKNGFEVILSYLLSKIKDEGLRINNMPLILETKHDKVKTDLKILKELKNKIYE